MQSTKKIITGIIMAILITLSPACQTIPQYQIDPHDYRAMAVASCSDLQTTEAAVSALVAWTKIYFPNQRDLFEARIEPVLATIHAGIDAYCALAEVVDDVHGWQDLMSEREELMALAGKIKDLIDKVRASR